VATHGYDPVYGARPLKRAVQKYILDPLSMEILEGKVREGQRIKVDAANDTLTFAPECEFERQARPAVLTSHYEKTYRNGFGGGGGVGSVSRIRRRQG